MAFESFPVVFFTTLGPVKFDIVTSIKSFGGISDIVFKEGNCAILMFDVSSMITYKNISRWYKDLRRIREDIPVVLVGNKVSLRNFRIE